MNKARVSKSGGKHGAVLVITLLLIVVLAVATVAFMQNTSTDRQTARSIGNHYRAQLAAEAGLAEAMALIQSNATDFGYVSGAEPHADGYRTYMRPRSVAGGVWQFSGERVYLDSGRTGELAQLLVSGTNATDGVVARAAYKTISSANNATNRYAFWVDDGSGKQNLSWWGGDGAVRSLLDNIANAALALPSANGGSVAPMPTDALKELDDIRSYTTNTTNLFGQSTRLRSVTNSLLTPATLNLLDEGLGGRASSYFFTLSSPSSAVSPAGRRKLNLQHLARYLNSGISSAQGAGQPRANIVEQLLLANPPQATNWGGGDLNWLATAGKYSPPEQRQIVANLLDYLDDDLIPTTDSVDNPTYFGVEMKIDSAGRIIGHPFINFVTAGLIFNRNAGGEVNSTRVLSSIGMAYPWTSTSVSAAAYTPEINIAVEGTVLNEIPAIGSEAGSYFRTDDLTEQILSRPVSVFTPHSGDNWPQAAGLAGSASYATPFYGFTTGNWPTRGPTNLTFQNARYVIKKMRLRYTPTGGGASGYVQIVPTNMTIDVLPTSLVAGGVSGALQVKFSSGGPYAETPNLYLNNDPRASFLRASWTNLPSLTSFGTSIPAPAEDTAIDLTNGVSSEWDEAQGLNTDFNWYTSTAVTNHLSRFGSTNFQSIGEVGYLWTGKPWQTLNLTRTNTPATADYNLLDYLAGGFTNGADVFTTMPLLEPSTVGGATTQSNSLLQDGGFNVLTRKLATVTAYLTNAPGISGSAAADLTSLPPPEVASLGGALAQMTDLSSETTTKFGREGVVRAMANGAVMQSRIFTVYSRGEYVLLGTRSQALLEADVFVDVDPETGAPVLRVISKRFL
jgi:hypothetical protein